MVKPQQRRTDRCFLPVGSNNVTLVRFPAQRRPQPPAHEAAVRETPGGDGETEAKRMCISGSEETLTNREAAPESCDQTGSQTLSLEVSSGDGVQQVAPESSEDNRAAELASAGVLKVTIQRSSESREFGEKDPASERFTCHICHCTCPSAQSFQQHMAGVDHQRRLHQITQSVAFAQHAGWRRGAPEHWCDLCQTHFTGDVILHRRTKVHKECKKSSRPFCSVCRRHFRTPRKFVEHMKSPEHKQQVQLEKSQEDEMITVDAVGCFESEPKLQFRSEKGADGKDTKQDGKEESRRDEETREEKDAQLGVKLGTTEFERRRHEERGGEERGGEERGGEERGGEDGVKGPKRGDEIEGRGLELRGESEGGEGEGGKGEGGEGGEGRGGESEGGEGRGGESEGGEGGGGEGEGRGGESEGGEGGGGESEGGEGGGGEGGEGRGGESEGGEGGGGESEGGEGGGGEGGGGEGEGGEGGEGRGGESEGGEGEGGEGGEGGGGEAAGGEGMGGEVGDTEDGMDTEELMEADVNPITENIERDQEFNPHTVYGASYVVPVSGFFCRLCHKFFRESSAQEQHCRTYQHFTKVLQRQSGPDQSQECAELS